MSGRGTVSPTKVARLLGVHLNTVYRWCHASVNGEPSPLRGVSRNPLTGYFSISLAEVIALREQAKEP